LVRRGIVSTQYAPRVRRKATIAMQSTASIALLNSETVFVAREKH